MAVEISSLPGGGFLVSDGKDSSEITLDGKRAKGLFCVTHAHTDHLPTSVLENSAGIASPETFAFARERWNLEIPGRGFSPKVNLLEAGHMVGSKMVSVETSAGKLLYTGDFSTRDRFFLSGAKPEKCDVLIVDSTFGSPDFSFPKISEVLDSARGVLEMARGRAIFYGYSYGKAQVLTRIANELGIAPIAQAEVYSANSISERFSHNIGKSILYGTREAEKLIHSKSPAIVVAPLTAKNTLFSRTLEKVGFSSAVFTGWAASSFGGRIGGFDSAIPLSDHADFGEILSFVEGCSPKKVIVAHAKKDAPIVSSLRLLGFDAVPANGKGFSVRI